MRGRGKGCLTLPGVGGAHSPHQDSMGCIFLRSRLAVCLGILEWFMARLQTAGLQPVPLAQPAKGGGPC